MCTPSEFFNNGYSIVGTEVFLLLFLSILIIYRLGDKKSISSDLERIEIFLNKIDEESLIKLCEIDEHDDQRNNNNMRCEVNKILQSKRYIREHKTGRDVNKHVKTIDDSFINLFRLSVAIKTRHLNTISADKKKELMEKLDSIIRDRNRD